MRNIRWNRVAMYGAMAVAGLGMMVGIAAANGDDPAPSPIEEPAAGGRTRKVEPKYVDYELPGPNLYFFCDGTYGVYVTEGANGDSGKSAAPFVVTNHSACPSK